MDVSFLVLLVGLFSCMSAQQLYCPGRSTINCSTAQPVIWDGTAFNDQCLFNGISFVEVTEDNIGDTTSCGVLNVTITNVITVVNVGVPLITVESSLSFNAQPSFSGSTVHCTTGANAVNAVEIELLIPDLTSSVSVSQDSLTAVTVNLTVGDRRCASLYFIEVTQLDSSAPPIVMNNFSASFSVTGLDLCMNRYSVVGFVKAPSSVQGERSSPQIIGLRAVTNVVGNPTTQRLTWTQPASTASDGCISGYVVSWTNGEDTTVGSNTSTLVSNLNNFPFCQTRNLTVTPNTPSGPLLIGTTLQNVMFQHPEFTAPIVSVFFTFQSNNVIININWQDVSLEAVPVRLFGFGEGECNPQSNTTGSSAKESVPGAQPGDSYTVCVVFINNECMERTDAVIPRLITDPQQAIGVTSISITITLPVSPPMSPDSLSILSTIDPPDDSAKFDDYPTPSLQYTVTFDGLDSETTYTYDIRVVLRNDSTTTIGLPVTGSFTIQECGTACKAGIGAACAFIVLVILGSAGVFGGYKYKTRSKDKSKKTCTSEDSEKHELTRSSPPQPPDSLYADPKSIEHQPAPGTEDQYAMVDRKAKKNTKPKPTPPEALYQDPNTIEHKTAASGDTYAVVDKPKRSSMKKGGPDVVPPASEGLTYADIDLSSKRPKPGSGRQAPQQPGEYPKEHPVEYSSVDHGNTSQL